MTNPQNQAAEGFEYVFEQEVLASKADRYYAWSEKLHALAARQPGFIHQERRQVSEAGGLKRFETTLRFDTAEHCVNWLDNPERRRLLNLEEEQAGFAFRGHGNWEGYARWLSPRLTTEPPKWKVNLLVLLTLYPVAMLLTPLLHLTLRGFGLPSVMLISNILCVAATSWVLVPFASRFYLRWLEGKSGTWHDIAAVASLFAIIAILFSIFQALPAGFWG